MRHLSTLLIVVLVCGCEARASANQGRNYRVQPGESLFSIAEKSYGSGFEWNRIWEANPHLDPDRLRAGQIIYIPAREDAWSDPPPDASYYAADPGNEAPTPLAARQVSRNPGRSAGEGFHHVFRDLKTTVTQSTVFGFTLDKAFFFLFVCFFFHAILQSMLVWLAANITFVKDVSFKKSMKAVFMTEMLTFTTLLVLTAVGIVLVQLGSGPTAAGGQLFPAFEDFLGTPTGAAVTALIVLALYVTLSLRFLPQVFGVPLSHAITVMALAILIPHLIGAYLVGQRTGLIG